MREGTGFGELALKKERMIPRAATIICDLNCDMAVMSKANYQKVLSRIEQRNQSKLLNFFQNIPCLKNNSHTYLSKLLYSFE
jgi:hypothetical protein